MRDTWRRYRSVELNEAYRDDLVAVVNGRRSTIAAPGPCPVCSAPAARWQPLVVSDVLAAADLHCHAGHRWTVSATFEAAS